MKAFLTQTLFIIFFSQVVWGAAPINDVCANATVLTSSPSCSYISGTVAEATGSGSGCSGNPNDDVWYTFTATSTQHTISVISSTEFDAVIEMLSACNGTLQYCINNTYEGAEELLFARNLTIGSTYIFRVYHVSAQVPATTTFQVCLTATPVPANDNCANATNITVSNSCNAINGMVMGASQSLAACSGAADDDVWYSFSAASANTTIRVNGASGFDPVVELFSDCSGTSITCMDARADRTEEILATGLTVGQVYYVRVYHFNLDFPPIPEFTICIFNTPQVPVNDNCSNAISLVPSATCNLISGTTLGATESLSGCSGNANDDVWYSFTPTVASVDIQVIASPTFDPVIELFSGCGTGSITCEDNSGAGSDELISINGLTVGATYYFRVYHYSINQIDEPDFEVCVRNRAVAPPPANDDCANALLLSQGSECVPVEGSTYGATQSFTGCTGNANDDVWFRFQPTSTNPILEVTGLSGFDAVLHVLDACNGNTLACLNNKGSGNSEVYKSSGLTIGATYYARVYHATASKPDTSSFRICLKDAPPVPSNDECPNATALVVNATCVAVNGTTLGASQSLSGCQGLADDDVWYSFTATDDSITIRAEGSIGFDAVIELFDACGGMSLGCTDQTGSGGVERLYATSLTIGSVYKFRIYHYSDEAIAPAQFSVCVTETPPAPANDQCNMAIALTPATTCTPVTGTSESATQSLPGCIGNANDDVWYSFNATQTRMLIEAQGGNEYNPVLEIFDGCAGASILCADNTFSGDKESLYASTLTIGNTYYLRIYHAYQLTPENAMFNICVSEVAAPANDACSGAQAITVNDYCAYTDGTLTGATSTSPACLGTIGADVWYSFTAPSQQVQISALGSLFFDAVTEVLDACSGASLACTNEVGNGMEEITSLTGLTTGNTYYLRIYHNGSQAPSSTTFSVCAVDLIASTETTRLETNLAQVYPNPTQEKVMVKFPQGSVLQGYRLLSALGTPVLTKEQTYSSEAMIPLNGIPDGVYMLELKFNGEVQYLRLCVSAAP
ncbi:MAG: T9SS type A sorting domain-containing protein [Cytophagaceae bacterium]|jgi:hypothetical protein|nr:T9SS type A sorting domain-containing protein [Cytophagaceae bacterium]